jgi:hypothetical protein
VTSFLYDPLLNQYPHFAFTFLSKQNEDLSETNANKTANFQSKFEEKVNIQLFMKEVEVVAL